MDTMKFCTDTHIPLRMNYNNFNDTLTFHHTNKNNLNSQQPQLNFVFIAASKSRMMMTIVEIICQHQHMGTFNNRSI